MNKDERRNQVGCCHCMHPHRGVVHMVLPDGHRLMTYCKCGYSEAQHVEHAVEHRVGRRWS